VKCVIDGTWKERILLLEAPEGMWASYYEDAKDFLPYLTKYVYEGYFTADAEYLNYIITGANAPSPRFGNDKVSVIYVNSTLELSLTLHYEKNHFRETIERARRVIG